MTISLEDMAARNNSRTNHGVTVETHTTYRRQWEKFKAACAEYGQSPLPADPEIVAYYLDEMAKRPSMTTGKPLGVSSFRAACNAIRFYHGEAKLPSPTDDDRVSAMLKTLRRERPIDPNQANPLDDELLIAIARTACQPRQLASDRRKYRQRNARKRPETHAAALKRGLREVALCYLMSFSGMRIGEASGLKWRNINEREEDGAASIYIERAKGNKTRYSAIPRQVVLHLRAIQNGAEPSDAVFRTRKNRAAHPKTLARWIAEAVEGTGRSDKGFSGHSGRSASSQRLARNNCPREIRNNHHGWKGGASDGMATYYTRALDCFEVLAYMQ